MNQLSLIDYIEAKLARSSDPVESHEAAKHVASKRTALQVEFMASLMEIGNGTANEVAANATGEYSHRESLRKRAKELLDSGKIRKAESRKCRVTGNTAAVYEVNT